MPIEILMPALSPTMTEGNLVKWHKKEGDAIESGDLLAEIETDKATMEVEAVDEGILGKILVSEGTKDVPVNNAIALILEEGEDKSALEDFSSKKTGAPKAETPKEKEVTPASQPAPMPTPAPSSSDRVLASPLAKRLAAQNNINLAGIQGSGPKGRIVKNDVLGAPSGAASSKQQSAAKAFQPVYGAGGYHDEPVNQMRKVIAERLATSKQTAPHFYVSIDCRMDELLTMRKRLNEGLDESQKISVNDIIIKACALTLKTVPAANVSWMGDVIRFYENADVSVAVSIEGGLITPIVKAAELKSLLQISAEAKELIKKARAGQLAPEEFQGGTFTISNMGMYGVKQFNAVINPPQSCIIAIGAANEMPVVVDGEIKIASQMTATLSADHRAVDGAVAAEFMATFKKYIENPLLILA